MLGTAAQLALLAQVTGGEHDDTRLLLLYLLVSRRYGTGMPANFDDAGVDVLRSDGRPSLPLPAVFLRRHFRRASWQALERAGLVESRPYSRARRLCREFRVVADFHFRFLEAGPTPGDVLGRRLVDLVSGRPTEARMKSVLTAPGNNALPPLVAAAIRAIPSATFNLGAIRAHVASLQAAVDIAPDGAARATALAQYLNDAACLQAVLAQGARPVDPAAPDSFWTYRPAYRTLTTGRISQIGGGLQTCQREMKEAAWSGVAGLRNYDLQASQAMLLVAFLREAGIDPSSVHAYLAEGKEAAAALVGLPVDDWKRCLYATLMGARVPAPGQAEFSRGAVRMRICAAAGPARSDAVYAAFYAYTAGIREALGHWHTWLVDVYVRENGRRVNATGRTYVTNAVGATADVDALREIPHKLRSRLAAHVLQGREAALTHALAAMGHEFGYEVYAHEHDGLVVAGEIPPVAVDRAAVVAGLPRDLVVLEEKPFV